MNGSQKANSHRARVTCLLLLLYLSSSLQTFRHSANDVRLAIFFALKRKENNNNNNNNKKKSSAVDLIVILIGKSVAVRGYMSR